MNISYVTDLDQFQFDFEGMALYLSPMILSLFFSDARVLCNDAGGIYGIICREEQWENFLVVIGREQELADFMVFATKVRPRQVLA